MLYHDLLAPIRNCNKFLISFYKIVLVQKHDRDNDTVRRTQFYININELNYETLDLETHLDDVQQKQPR